MYVKNGANSHKFSKYFLLVCMFDTSANWVREEKIHAKITRVFAPPCMHVLYKCIVQIIRTNNVYLCYDIIL